MTELRAEPYEIPAADLGAENPLPTFRPSDDNLSVEVDPTISEEDRKYFGWRTAYRVLPYRLQDGYNRVQKPRAFKSMVLENEHLRATFLPELGGRLVSLYNKNAKRELLEKNPVFQPANLALRNAWFSGGVEWNTSHFGHYYLTCAPVFAARISGPRCEPALRIYEWDRAKCFPWQIDFHLPSGSQFLFARVRIVNPHESELPMYWWSNIAVPEGNKTRTICPADTCISSPDGRAVANVKLPNFQNFDVTYATNLPGARECFFHIAGDQRRWVAALDESGTGLVHTSTDRLRGRKVFYWGMNPGGRRWQEFLSVPGRAYLEIQAGLARTQIECIPMPPRAEWTWTEAYGMLQADPKKVHSANWNEAWKAADAELNTLLPRASVDAFDKEFDACTKKRADEILAYGSGWGALERRRVAAQKQPDNVPAELVFGNLSEDQTPWMALLSEGALPEREPNDDPGHIMVQPEWQKLLESSLKDRRGNHWLSQWHLGNMRMETRDYEGAREAWNKSLAHRRTGWALRNMAVLECRLNGKKLPGRVGPGSPEPVSTKAADLLLEAWEAGPKIPQLAIECATMLLNTAQYKRLWDFACKLPADIRANERIDILSARAALEMNELTVVEKLFTRNFATIREGEITLTDIWFALHERKLAAKENAAIDESLKKRVRKEFPPPHHIDFRLIHEIQ